MKNFVVYSNILLLVLSNQTVLLVDYENMSESQAMVTISNLILLIYRIQQTQSWNHSTKFVWIDRLLTTKGSIK